MAVVRGFMSKATLQMPMLKTIQWKFMTVRCASGPTRRDITEGPPPQINGTPKTEAVTDEDRPVITTGPPPQINQVPQKNGVTTDEEEQNGANGSNRKRIPAQVLKNL
ncbi:hypothetical protein PRUPE_4G159600 [Prunus persica]|uniref:Uncharacterized protein n=2 Tax=Prunus persica TaxID=3760 RepID=A0A251PLC6_PRUPE|nr:hypothetical protein PRUPE_4G159600 [Prunus persica]